MNSPFREQVKQDIEGIFLNKNELAKDILWNGHLLTVVEDANIPLDAQYSQGVDLEIRRLVCGARDISPHPMPFEQVEIDKELWLVREVRNPPGFLLITLERRRG